ncbi:hypothetical protein BV898_18022 [Hypsibius exemplaris]|uniref:Uncharacterized protein n=1 Tax=Hypsibius exemplaris TaxID=2072580 RepID=A0A9X6RNE4_HYPEX|nr:hypothetical protein BV898_18022 [Hypsibius exemplaris]
MKDLPVVSLSRDEADDLTSALPHLPAMKLESGWTISMDQSGVPVCYRNSEMDVLRESQVSSQQAMVWSLATDDFNGFCDGKKYGLTQILRDTFDASFENDGPRRAGSKPKYRLYLDSTRPANVTCTSGLTVKPAIDVVTVKDKCKKQSLSCTGNQLGGYNIVNYYLPGWRIADPQTQVGNDGQSSQVEQQQVESDNNEDDTVGKPFQRPVTAAPDSSH